MWLLIHARIKDLDPVSTRASDVFCPSWSRLVWGYPPSPWEYLVWLYSPVLAHWSLAKTATTWQDTFSNSFPCMKIGANLLIQIYLNVLQMIHGKEFKCICISWMCNRRTDKIVGQLFLWSLFRTRHDVAIDTCTNICFASSHLMTRIVQSASGLLF